MKVKNIDERLDIQYKDDKDLFNILLDILGYTKGRFALKFDITEEAVSNWTREGRDVPRWALIYLLDIVSLELRLMGYILKVKKMTTLTNEIRDLQEEIGDMRLEDFELPQTPLHFNIGGLVTDDIPINIDILVNSKNILMKFCDENKTKVLD